MLINRKILITMAISSVVTIVALTSMAPQQEKEEGFKNVEELPKSLTEQQLHMVMREWSISLGVRCNFCHAPSADGKGLDFPSDAKPEKTMARHMYKMMNKINSKYFEAQKDSLGMVMRSGVNCYTCHRGESHPETKLPEMKKPGGPGPGGPPPGSPAPGGPGAPQKQ